MHSLVNTHTKIVHPVKSFALKSSMEFASRSLSVFNDLNTIEMNHNAWVSENETHDSFDLNNNNIPPPVTSDTFKKPFAPVPRKRKSSFFPYKRNVRKWIKYSLEDVPISSDATNTAVALQFLDELRKKKEKNIIEENSSDDQVVFRKPSKRLSNVNNTIDSASTSTNEVWEQHPESEKIPLKKLKTSNSNIKLLHLQDDFDDA